MARRPRSFALVLIAALSLAAPALSGCGNSDLVETEVPGGSVELRYDLQPGETFEGTIRRKETVTMRGQPMNRSIEFKVQLVVNSVDDDGTASVAATVSGIELNWVVQGLPISTAEFNRQAKARLEGVTIRFKVDPMGRVSDIPPAPPQLEQAEVGVLDSIVEGLTSGFFVVPEDRLSVSQGWDKQDTRGREGKLGKYTEETVRGVLEGAYTHKETGETLIKLDIDGDKQETTTTKDGSSSVRTRSDIEILWNIDDHYLTLIDSTSTRTQGPNSTVVQFQAEWIRSIAGATASGGGPAPVDTPADAEHVKSGDDPCGDDYVGAGECLDPCSVNYMGDETCGADADEGDAGAAADGDAAADAESGEADSDDAGGDDATSDAAEADADGSA